MRPLSLIVLCVFVFQIVISNGAQAKISEAEFYTVAQNFIKVIIPMGKRVYPDYKRSVVLNKDLRFGTWSSEPIQVNQGVIDDKNMTSDGLALILCHEVGHDLKLARYYLGTHHYAFNHLEQDYFATRTCLRPYMDSQKKSQAPESNDLLHIPLGFQTRCETQFQSEDGVQKCLRGLHASWIVIDAMYRYFELSSINTHPKPSFDRNWLGPKDVLQARLLNLANGVLEDLPFNER